MNLSHPLRHRQMLCTAALAAFCVINFSAPATAQFEARGAYPTLEYPNSIAVGDFNHDGKLDLAVACRLRSSQVSVLLGNGDGTFQPAVNYTVGNTPVSVAVADFNHDGNLDLAVAGSGVSVLLGNGDGTFQPAKNFDTTAVATFVGVGDFNGDHIPDLVLATSPNISVLLGNGDGTFQAPINYTSLPTYIPAVAVGDFNGDGKLDLAALAPNTGFMLVAILLGNGDGSFSPGATYPIPAAASALAAADLRNNGKLDLAIADGSGADVLLGNGDGTFEAGVVYAALYGVSVAIADFNGDGKPDLAVAGLGPPAGVSVLLGNGNGTFQPETVYPDVKAAAFVATGDFNGDHKVDMVLADDSQNDDVVPLLNTGTATFSPTAPVNFPFQLVGAGSSPQTVTITNTGTTALAISSIKVEGPFQIKSTCGPSVVPGGNCAVKVVFKPKAEGNTSGIVSIDDSASSKPQVIDLTGAGTIVSLVPGKLQFSPQKVGTAGPPLTVQVQNEGGTALTFTNIYIETTDDQSSKDFSQSNTCGSQLAAGASCTVTVTFKPSKTGLRSAILGFLDSGGGSPQTIGLTGTGT